MDLKTFQVVILMTVPFFAMTIWAIVNAAQKEFGSTANKALWVAVSAIPFIGFIIYLLFGFRKGKKAGST